MYTRVWRQLIQINQSLDCITCKVTFDLRLALTKFRQNKFFMAERKIYIYMWGLTKEWRRSFNESRFQRIYRATSSLSLRSAGKLGHFPSTRGGEIGRLAGIKKKATPFSLPSSAPFATSPSLAPHRPKTANGYKAFFQFIRRRLAGLSLY